MSFDVAADAYMRFMGRYSVPLAEQYVDLVDARPGDRVVDVGCGPPRRWSTWGNRVGREIGKSVSHTA
jgi:trans-aconitate methyltransferase